MNWKEGMKNQLRNMLPEIGQGPPSRMFPPLDEPELAFCSEYAADDLFFQGSGRKLYNRFIFSSGQLKN